MPKFRSLSIFYPHEVVAGENTIVIDHPISGRHEINVPAGFYWTLRDPPDSLHKILTDLLFDATGDPDVEVAFWDERQNYILTGPSGLQYLVEDPQWTYPLMQLGIPEDTTNFSVEDGFLYLGTVGGSFTVYPHDLSTSTKWIDDLVIMDYRGWATQTISVSDTGPNTSSVGFNPSIQLGISLNHLGSVLVYKNRNFVQEELEKTYAGTSALDSMLKVTNNTIEKLWETLPKFSNPENEFGHFKIALRKNNHLQIIKAVWDDPQQISDFSNCIADEPGSNGEKYSVNLRFKTFASEIKETL